jgi:serine acetyltransferase
MNYIEYKMTRRVSRARVVLRKLLIPWIQFVPSWRLRTHLWRLCGANLHPSVWIARNAMLDEETLELITIDEGVRISYQTMLITHSGLDKKIGPIHIGRQAWVGAGCIILPDVTIGAYAVVGAGSLVHHDVKEDTTVFGSPAKVIKRSGVPKEWIHVSEANYGAAVAAGQAAATVPSISAGGDGTHDSEHPAS